MESAEYSWKLGDIVELPRKTRRLDDSLTRAFEQLINSKYVCVREATEKTRGMLVKILGKSDWDDIMYVADEPYCKDDKDETFRGDIYYSFRFPSVKELQTVFDIVQEHPELVDRFKETSMRLNVNSTFWVRETSRKFLFMKQAQYYKDGQLFTASDDNRLHYRLTTAYFYKSMIAW